MIKKGLWVCVIALAISGVSRVAIAKSWEVSVDEHEGLPSMSKGGMTALSSTFVFWGKNWAWADQQTQFKVTGPFEYSVSGKNLALNFDLAGRITQRSEHQL